MSDHDVAVTPSADDLKRADPLEFLPPSSPRDCALYLAAAALRPEAAEEDRVEASIGWVDRAIQKGE